MKTTKTPEEELRAARYNAECMARGLHSLIQDNIFREGWKSIGYEIEYKDYIVSRLFPHYEEWYQPFFVEDGDVAYYEDLKIRFIDAQKAFFAEHTSNLEEAEKALSQTLSEAEEDRGSRHKAEAAWKSVRDKLQNKYGWTYNRGDSRVIIPIDRGQLIGELWNLLVDAGAGFGRDDIDQIAEKSKDSQWMQCYKTFLNDGQSPEEAYQSANFVGTK